MGDFAEDGREFREVSSYPEVIAARDWKTAATARGYRAYGPAATYLQESLTSQSER
jgi:hypothetical protein